MCSKKYRIVVKLVKLTMHQLMKIFLCVFRRISKFTLYELLWITVIFSVAFVILSLNSDKDSTVLKKIGNPLILWWKSDFPGTSDTRYCSNSVKCDVISNINDTDVNRVDAFLFYASSIEFEDLPLPRRPKSIIWGLYHEESPRNVEELMHEDVLRLFNYSSTFSRHSDVPFPLQHLDLKEDITSKKYYVTTPKKNVYLKDIAPVMYLQTDCETSTERDAYVEELMKHIRIDSYGKCVKNMEMPAEFTNDYLNKLNEGHFLEFVARYKFVIAIENGVCNDYITEKFWRPIKVGTVPIYFGSPTIKDWFPNEKSAILLADFPTPKLLADHLLLLSNNDTLYEEYLEHKTKEIVTNQRLVRELSAKEYQTDALKVAEKFECFICDKLHSIKMGKVIMNNIVSRSHYDCPKPISALTLNVNPSNIWVQTWQKAKENAEEIYTRVMSN